ncbi:competence type IV pilus minor pilin ComGG [Vagococcus zengguangii]|uniref:Uncharacterized protein n=1 Tax=Vagococcus zengguangii TaxID=2571750 RepID=A0A4D7CS82_9ENTE|nr:competence type IV pilus minor pilin ComGG [Vagococcus zengguangii]QCI85734.1 hypothetical protein FA707_01565 [Vagococcus zengguangii]TLG81675.1 hypothetical protein FE258_00545 [Vagococcus zengguangii]
MKQHTSNYKGSILVSLLILMLMYMTVFNFIMHRYDQQQALVSTSIKRNKIETLANLAQFYLENNSPPETGTLVYSTGQVMYERKTTDSFRIEISLTTGEKRARNLVINPKEESTDK